jgi:hypothetical protein
MAEAVKARGLEPMNTIKIHMTKVWTSFVQKVTVRKKLNGEFLLCLLSCWEGFFFPPLTRTQRVRHHKILPRDKISLCGSLLHFLQEQKLGQSTFDETPGTDVMIFFKYFRKIGEKIGVFDSKQSRIKKILIIILVYEKTAKFFAENCWKSQKIVIISYHNMSYS